MRLWTAVFVLLLALLTFEAGAFERDVHFGLTRWLAIQAGYMPEQAQAIAIGNQRVDRGAMQFMELMSEFACGTGDVESSDAVRSHHFPGKGPLPLEPQQRAVIAGGSEALRASEQMLKADLDKVCFMLYKLGEALHSLQDSWSHQGVPEVPALPGLACNPSLAWGHPASRGGWNSHRADLTWPWAADTVAMAEASYRVLVAYPPIMRAKRVAAPWDKLKPLIAEFAATRTKAEKATWFAAQHIDDTSFLAGTSLPDGKTSFTANWTGDNLPRLLSMQSRQHRVDPDLASFFDQFFNDWATSQDFGLLGNRYAKPRDVTTPTTSRNVISAAELSARMQAWRIRDHGRVADLVHSLAALTPKQLLELKAMTRSPEVYASYPSAAAGYVPILPKTAEATPIVPYLVVSSPAEVSANRRAVATVRFTHTPYDTVSVVAEERGGRWFVTSLAPVIEH